MKKQSVRVPPARPPTHGSTVGNEILLRLSAKKRNDILSRTEFVRLPLHQILHEAGETIKSGYFVNDGLVSVLAVQPDGKSVEIGLIGKEGFVGLPLVVGYRSSPTRTIVQGTATAYRCDEKTLQAFLEESPELERQLHRFSHRLSMQTMQIAACNGLHGVEERLARWILMSQDRILSNTFPLTQEFLAHMLGTRRASVTISAGILQKAGLISYTRGSVTILDRARLEDAACDCYGIVQKQLRNWKKETD